MTSGDKEPKEVRCARAWEGVVPSTAVGSPLCAALYSLEPAAPRRHEPLRRGCPLKYKVVEVGHERRERCSQAQCAHGIDEELEDATTSVRSGWKITKPSIVTPLQVQAGKPMLPETGFESPIGGPPGSRFLEASRAGRQVVAAEEPPLLDGPSVGPSRSGAGPGDPPQLGRMEVPRKEPIG